MMTSDGHGGVDLVDLQLTVNYHEGHRVEVCVRVREVAGQDTHVVSAGCRLGHGPCGGLVGLYRSRHIIQVGACRHAGVAVDSMGLTIVINFSALLRHGHSGVDLVDLQLTVHNDEGHRVEVSVRVREVTGNKAHGISSGVRAAHCRVTTEGEVGSGVQRVGDDYVIAAHTVQLAVVVHRVAVLGDGHRHVNRLDHQLTILNVEGHVGEVVVRVREIARNKAHGICSGVHAAHCRITTEGKVGSGVQWVGDGHVIAAHCV